MTAILDKAVQQVKALPEERQDNYGEFLMTMLEQDQSELQLSVEQVAEINRRLAHPEEAVPEVDAMEFFKTLM